MIFISGGAVAVALFIGLGLSSWLFFKEKAARQRAVAAEWQAELERNNEIKLRRSAEIREKITQATVLINQGNYDAADELMRGISITQPTVEGANVFRELGEYHALRNDWSEAAGRFKVLMQINLLDGWDVCSLDYLRYGPTMVMQGDLTGYENFRREALTHFTGSQQPFADRIVKISLLLPANQKIMKILEPSAGVTVQFVDTNEDANGDIFLAAWRSVSQALLEYRNGNFQKAADWSQQSLNYPEYIAPRTATARIILAMSDYQLRKTNEAHTELDAAREIIDNKSRRQLGQGTPMQGFWFDWVFAKILLNEAVQLIESDSKIPLIH